MSHIIANNATNYGLKENKQMATFLRFGTTVKILNNELDCYNECKSAT